MHGIQYGINVADPLGIAGQLELSRRIDGYQDDGGQYSNDADDDQDFYQCESSAMPTCMPMLLRPRVS